MTPPPTIPDFREVLRNELSQRLSANAQYSLRAFARDLGVSAPLLSHVLGGRKGLSAKTAESIGRRLGWSDSEIQYFTALVMAAHGRSQASQRIAREKLLQINRSTTTRKTVELQLDAFRVISDWYHFPILEILKMKPKSDARSLARRFGLQELEVKIALGRLERLGLISRQKSEWLVRQDTVIAKEHLPSDAVRKFHTHMLEKARSAVLQQPPDERHFRTIVFPFKTARMAEAQREIVEFFESFSRKYSDAGGDEVYTLANQFFRLTRKETA